MRPRRSARQLLLFVPAILLPCGVLVALALRLMSQERELAEKRSVDQHRDAARIFAAALRARIDSILDRELSTTRVATSPIVARARIDSGDVRPLWLTDPGAREFARLMRDPAFARPLRHGEHLELIERRYGEAVAAYAPARAATNSALGHAWVDFLQARALHASGARSLERSFGTLASLGPELRDDEGVPLATYAMARLSPLSQRSVHFQDAFAKLATHMATDVHLSPSACYAIASIADSPLPRVRCRELERADSLFGSIDGKRWSAARPIIDTSGATWIVARRDSSAVALRLAPLLRGAAITFSEASGAAPLPGFAGAWLLRAPTDGEAPARSFYMLFVAFAVSAALFGSWLLWRDVRREVATAELRSQFVSGVTHELKTPLTAIRMFAETLRDRRHLREEQRTEYLDTVIGEAERLTRLLNNVLDFSSIERNERRYRPRSADVRACVESALRAMRHPLTQQGFTLLVHDQGTPMRAHCDPDAIEQAVLNLLSNAVKYSGASRELRVTLESSETHAVIGVSDHGIGIRAEEQARIFERFYRVADSVNDTVTGTGLGLTLVRHIMDAHRGEVTVRSAPGRGSTFTLRIPLESRHARAAESAPLQPLSLT